MDSSVMNVTFSGAKFSAAKNLQSYGLVSGVGRELLVSETMPPLSEMARQGMIFTARTLSGAPFAIPIYSTPTNAPSLWNPSSSGKIVVPLKILLTPVTLGTTVVDGFVLAQAASMGETVGTGLPILTWTDVVPICTRLGVGAPTPAARFANAVNTWTAATKAVPFMDLGLGQYIDGSPATSALQGTLKFEFTGEVWMKPGTVIQLLGNVASVTTYNTTFMWAELDAVN